MATKHYDINYLQNSRRLLIDLKEKSYTFFEATDNGTLVDLGCGAGSDVIAMAKKIGGQVHVTGIDHDPQMLQQARKDSEGMGNVDFIQAEAYPLPFEDASIAGLRTERVIQHLNNPEEVISEIARILKKDSPFVIIETDWHSLSFYTEFVDVQKKVVSYLTDKKVNNGFAAKKLLSYLHANNFKDIKFEIHPFVVTTLQAANEYFRIEQMAKEASEQGYFEDTAYQAFYNALKKADDEACFACSINLVLVSCIK